eukprot:CAMPEP_0204205318 /NCGR_PEP_ID=MMETSP0361-20130328/70247_1 /ASSEMBLY_ACC=CAM_ASM_000343 /TAXON_ID=268821 /ORGANISM="Scrippsiella Hangoei, Strain SHTV-5" /LENGTH=96 /DNA_ID=CAMNT_0051168555 /DNA_START=1769 /DNA_END=2057 /DNA_ORIENTATION=+
MPDPETDEGFASRPILVHTPRNCRVRQLKRSAWLQGPVGRKTLRRHFSLAFYLSHQNHPSECARELAQVLENFKDHGAVIAQRSDLHDVERTSSAT